MAGERWFIALSGLFPPVAIRNSADRDLAALGAEPGRYACMSLAFSSCSGIIGAVAAAVLGLGLLALPASAACFALVMSFMLLVPRSEASRRAAGIEAALPQFLRSIGMLLGMG